MFSVGISDPASDPASDLKTLLTGSFIPDGIDEKSGDIFYLDSKNNQEALKLLLSNYSDTDYSKNAQLVKTLLNETILTNPNGLEIFL